MGCVEGGGVGLVRLRVGLRGWCGRPLWLSLLALAMVATGVGPARAQATPPEGMGSGKAEPPAQGEGTHPPLTKDQAKELFRSVDEILQFVSKDADLPIKHTVKRKLLTRDEVNKYLTEKFNEDEGAKRLARSEIVLKKFGLLDRDFHLQPFMTSRRA